jgi:hypothetical protein
LQNAVLTLGYREAVIRWPSSTEFRTIHAEDQVRSFEYMKWCRDLFLAFERYGAEHAREVLEGLHPQMRREGIWSQNEIYTVWRTHRGATNDTQHLLQGWMDDDPTDLAESRSERVRLHSIDGISDVLNETTDFVAVYQQVECTPTTNGGTVTAVVSNVTRPVRRPSETR